MTGPLRLGVRKRCQMRQFFNDRLEDKQRREQIARTKLKKIDVKIMPFVTTFHPGVKNLKQILMQKMESNSKSAINQNYIEKPPIIIQS